MRVNVFTGDQDAPRVWTQNREFRGRSARRFAAAREHCLLVFPAHVGMRQYWRDFDSLEPLRRDGKAENLAPYQETELWCSAITTLDSEPLVMWAEIASGPRYISLPAYEFRFSGP